jgi:hypothetical protein
MGLLKPRQPEPSLIRVHSSHGASVTTSLLCCSVSFDCAAPASPGRGEGDSNLEACRFRFQGCPSVVRGSRRGTITQSSTVWYVHHRTTMHPQSNCRSGGPYSQLKLVLGHTTQVFFGPVLSVVRLHLVLVGRSPKRHVFDQVRVSWRFPFPIVCLLFSRLRAVLRVLLSRFLLCKGELTVLAFKIARQSPEMSQSGPKKDSAKSPGGGYTRD